MHDDPTRTMGTPEDPDHRPHGNMRLLVAGLVAVIVGLVIALVVVAGDDGGESAATLPSEVSTLPTTTVPTDLTTETTAPTTTEPTDLTTETTAPTTTETAPAPEGDEEAGSGGLEAP